MSIPKTIIWDITSKCNLNCIHCFNSDRYTAQSNNTDYELDTKECLKAIDKIANSGVPHLHLLGGEPLLKPDLFKIISYAKRYNMLVTINTNGIPLTKTCCKSLIDLGVDQIVVSLDGSVPAINDKIRGGGTFKKITRNILILKELINKSKSHMKLGIAFTMTKQNIDDISNMLLLAKTLNIDIIDIMDIYISGRAYGLKEQLAFTFEEKCKSLERLAENMRKINFENLVVQLDIPFSLVNYLNWRYSLSLHFHPRNMWCQAGERMWYMQADGRLLPCGMTNNLLYVREILNKKHYILENINIKYVSSLREVDHSDFFKSFRDFKLRVKQKIIFPCSNCKVKEVCLPCPVLHNSLIEVPDCINVMKYKEHFINEMLKKKIRIKKNSHWTYSDGQIKIWDEIFKTFRHIEGSGFIIWQLIYNLPDIEIKQIVDRIFTTHIDLPSKSEVEEDTIAFLYDLYLSQIIELC